MEYFLINDIDFSKFVCSLKVTRNVKYNSQTNANGDTLIDYINTKRTIEVGFIMMDGIELFDMFSQIQEHRANDIKYMDTKEGCLQEIKAFLPSHSIEFYTIQTVRNTKVKGFTLTFVEL